MNKEWLDVDIPWANSVTWIHDADEELEPETLGAIVYHSQNKNVRVSPVPYGFFLSLRSSIDWKKLDTERVLSAATVHETDSADTSSLEAVSNTLTFDKTQRQAALRGYAAYESKPHGEIDTTIQSEDAGLIFVIMLMMVRNRELNDACRRVATVIDKDQAVLLNKYSSVDDKTKFAIKYMIRISQVSQDDQHPTQTVM